MENARGNCLFFSDHDIQAGSCEKSCTAAVHVRMPCADREIVLLQSTMIACTHEASVAESLSLTDWQHSIPLYFDSTAACR